jgi:hypothetical protein
LRGKGKQGIVRTYLIVIREPRCRSDDREVGVAPPRQGRPLAKARNDLIDHLSDNPLMNK